MDKDVLLPFSLDNTNIKGKIVRLNKTSAKLLERFSTGISAVDKVFLDSLVLSQLISSNFKFDGTFKLQINGDGGIIKMILCDNKLNGNMRAYMGLHDGYVVGDKHSFQEIIGNGVMIFHLILPNSAKPYQAIVELSGNSLEDSAYNWFRSSEQTRTYIKIFSNAEKKSAAGLFLQKIPNQYATEEEIEQEEEIFNTLKILSDTLKEEEILEDSLEDVLYKLYNEFDVRLFEETKVSYKCTCSAKKIKEVVAAMSLEEQEELRKDNNVIKITCSFCGKEYQI
ncbi:MAG: Hsp33 family molecular chaperone HslO [Alphaproteobacteria bacterium]|jgi:molecular chaperone Hsp33|nr:Hsp33 family molecular chaperone HslO [Alphaproteobacteria bacterium]